MYTYKHSDGRVLMFVTGVIMWWQRVMRKRPVRVEAVGTEEAA